MNEQLLNDLQRKVDSARADVAAAVTVAQRRKAVAAYDKAFADLQQVKAAIHIEKSRGTAAKVVKVTK